MNIKAFISDYRLKQTELSELFGCKQANVSNIVNGRRPITGLQIRQLIDKFGFDVIAKYADPGEMPVAPSVNIDLSDTKISGNTAPVQNGSGNSMSPDAGLVALLQQQADLLAKKDAQMDRLISLLEDKYGKQ